MPAGVHALLRPCAATWDAVRGSSLVAAGWAQHRPVAALPTLDSQILHASVAGACRNIPAGVVSGAIGAVVIRGPQHNGRATLAAALAREMNKGVIEVTGVSGAADERWRTAATLAHLLDAVILTRLDPGPSDVMTLPELSSGLVPLFVTVGAAGALAGSLAHRATTIWSPVPDRDARRQLWASVLGQDGPGLPELRLTSGNIVRAAQLALASAAPDGGAALDTAVLKNAIRSLERPGLDALARRLKPAAGWSRLAASSDTLGELTTLEARCRQRERLAGCVGEALDDLSPGVRALFKGPSGTGKTLAARMLAGALEMDLYRVDLSAVVNKYIGETEKNLERVFARAEELDVILLLDEGDALLTQRTGVQSANDRYANLETNYLLQRLESFDGILIVTTNAPDRIDSAFQRRMDVVIDFAPPDASERWAIWQMHLPSTHHVEQDLLYAAAQRCSLTGGQIRNAALHASLLAVEAGAPVTSSHLETAIEREYRAAGAISPLRRRAGGQP
jgi:AAA+ superfamily predicted ATPase